MKKIYWLPLALFVAVVSVLNYSMIQADERMSLDDLPPAVRATIEQHADGGQIVEVEKEMERGHVVYEAEVRQNGRKMEILVSTEGEFLDVEVEGDDDGEDEGEIGFRDLPAAVKATLRRDYPDIRFSGFSKEVEDGHDVFEAAYTAGAIKHEIAWSADGYVLESEEEVAYASLPLSVQETIHARYGGATVEEVEAVQVNFYEVELKTADGEEVEVKVLADGRMLGAEDAD